MDCFLISSPFLPFLQREMQKKTSTEGMWEMTLDERLPFFINPNGHGLGGWPYASELPHQTVFSELDGEISWRALVTLDFWDFIQFFNKLGGGWLGWFSLGGHHSNKGSYIRGGGGGKGISSPKVEERMACYGFRTREKQLESKITFSIWIYC